MSRSRRAHEILLEGSTAGTSSVRIVDIGVKIMVVDIVTALRLIVCEDLLMLHIVAIAIGTI